MAPVYLASMDCPLARLCLAIASPTPHRIRTTCRHAGFQAAFGDPRGGVLMMQRGKQGMNVVVGAAAFDTDGTLATCWKTVIDTDR